MLISLIVLILALAAAFFYSREKDEKKRKRMMVAYCIFMGTMLVYMLLLNGRYHPVSNAEYFDKWTKTLIEARWSY